MFPKGKKQDIPVGQRLGLPYVRSLQSELAVKLPLGSLLHSLSSIKDRCDEVHSEIESGSESEDRVISIWQDGQGLMAISGVVWDCGLLCTDFLCHLANPSTNTCLPNFDNVLDVGCGTGICGVVALHLGVASLGFTDFCRCDALDNNLDSLSIQLKQNSFFVQHSWETIELPVELQRDWDVLLCSDLWYQSKTHLALLNFIRTLSFRHAFFAYKKRHDEPEELFFTQLSESHNLRVIASENISLKNLCRSDLDGTGLFLLWVTPKSQESH
jgi:hypothetical protein